jgi:hypothetical protein
VLRLRHTLVIMIYFEKYPHEAATSRHEFLLKTNLDFISNKKSLDTILAMYGVHNHAILIRKSLLGNCVYELVLNLNLIP